VDGGASLEAPSASVEAPPEDTFFQDAEAFLSEYGTTRRRGLLSEQHMNTPPAPPGNKAKMMEELIDDREEPATVDPRAFQQVRKVAGSAFAQASETQRTVHEWETDTNKNTVVLENLVDSVRLLQKTSNRMGGEVETLKEVAKQIHSDNVFGRIESLELGSATKRELEGASRRMDYVEADNRSFKEVLNDHEERMLEVEEATSEANRVKKLANGVAQRFEQLEHYYDICIGTVVQRTDVLYGLWKMTLQDDLPMVTTTRSEAPIFGLCSTPDRYERYASAMRNWARPPLRAPQNPPPSPPPLARSTIEAHKLVPRSGSRGGGRASSSCSTRVTSGPSRPMSARPTSATRTRGARPASARTQGAALRPQVPRPMSAHPRSARGGDDEPHLPPPEPQPSFRDSEELLLEGSEPGSGSPTTTVRQATAHSDSNEMLGGSVASVGTG